jgi:hypothetical protein
MLPPSIIMDEQAAQWVGLDLKANWTDMALGRVKADHVAALLTETKLYRSQVLMDMNDDYNSLSSTVRYTKGQKRPNLNDNHIMKLYKQSKIVILPKTLDIEQAAHNNDTLPSWVDINSGLGLRYNNNGQKIIIFNPVIVPMLDDIRGLIGQQHALSHNKFDMAGTKRTAIEKHMRSHIDSMNKIVRHFKPA